MVKENIDSFKTKHLFCEMLFHSLLNAFNKPILVIITNKLLPPYEKNGNVTPEKVYLKTVEIL